MAKVRPMLANASAAVCTFQPVAETAAPRLMTEPATPLTEGDDGQQAVALGDVVGVPRCAAIALGEIGTHALHGDQHPSNQGEGD